MDTQSSGGRIAHRIDLEMICPYEPGRPIEEVRKELGLSRVIKLASNENPLGPSPLVIETLNNSDLELHMYPDCEGWYLREALARRLRIPTEQIVLGAGSVELMRLVVDTFLERGDEAIVADLCFPVYENLVRLAGASPVIVPLDAELRYDLDGMLKAVSPRTKLVFIASPNNPTGRFLPLSEIETFVRRLPRTVGCVLDLAYWEYVEGAADEPLIGLLDAHPNVIILRTFSKVYGLAGLRIGYALASSMVASWLNRIRIPFTCSTAAQVAARASLKDDMYLARSVSANREIMARSVQDLLLLGARPHPSQANFVLVDFRVDSELLFRSLLQRGIIVRPMRHPRLATCLRITIGTGDQMDELMGALREELPR